MSEISKKDRFTVPAVICLICNVLLFIHLCGAGAYAGGNLHYEAANTQMFGGKVPWSAGQSCGIFAFLTVSSF